MHPRTVFIFVGAILLIGFGARWVVYHYNLLPLNKEMVLRQAVALASRGELPPFGVHILLGETAAEKVRNAARNIEERRTRPVQIVCRRPG